MSTTMAIPYFGSATPRLPNPHKGLAQSIPEETESTPLALDTAAPALREALLQFSGKFGPLHPQERIRIACAGDFGRALISSASVPDQVLVFKVGETSRVDPEKADPLAVLDRIQDELAVTQKELLAATGIRRRTYYSWKNPATPRPRPSSLGRLWHLADALVDLRETLERPIAVWLHSSPERMAAFKEGRFDDLVDLGVAMSKPAQRARGFSQRIGLAADVEVPIVKTGRPKVTVVERGANVDNR